MTARLLSALVISFALVTMSLAQEEEAPAPEPPRLVKLISASQAGGMVTRRFFGRVVAKQTVDLAFQVGGQLLQFPIIEGEPIPQGELVAQLDLEPFELELEQAKLEQDQAERDFERLSKLGGNTVSQVQVDDAQTAANLANVAVKNAERSLRNATLTAPFDGLVAMRSVSNFETIAAGTAIARLHDMSDLRMEIDVPEILFQRAGEDPDVSLVAKFFGSDNLFPVETREFIAQTTEVGQSFTITLGMAPQPDLVVLPGSSVEVIATLNEGNAFVEIPYTAVIFDEDGTPAVMVFEPAGGDEGADEGVVRRVQIETDTDNNGTLLVTSGLDASVEVVASGAAFLKDGQSVRRFNGFPN